MSELILSVGHERFIRKHMYHQENLERLGLKIHFIVRKLRPTGITDLKTNYQNITFVTPSFWKLLFATYTKLYKQRPKFIEIYETGRLTLAYFLLGRLFRCSTVLVLRGQEFQKKRSFFYSLSFFFVLRKIDKVVCKEQNLFHQAMKHRSQNVYLIGNSVRLPKGQVSKKSKRNIDILYLNYIRKERELVYFFEALKNENVKDLNLKIVMVGFSPENPIDTKYEEQVLKWIWEAASNGVDIDFVNFTNEPLGFFQDAKVFIFPSPVIYANHSLLEAMGSGCVPIVTQGEGVEKIVNEKNGISIENHVDEWVKALLTLFKKGSNLSQMSIEAQIKIEQQFSNNDWSCVYAVKD